MGARAPLAPLPLSIVLVRNQNKILIYLGKLLHHVLMESASCILAARLLSRSVSVAEIRRRSKLLRSLPTDC